MTDALREAVECGLVDLDELTERRREFTKETMFPTVDVDALTESIDTAQRGQRATEWKQTLYL